MEFMPLQGSLVINQYNGMALVFGERCWDVVDKQLAIGKVKTCQTWEWKNETSHKKITWFWDGSLMDTLYRPKRPINDFNKRVLEILYMSQG